MDEPHCADPELADDIAYGRKCADLYGKLLKHEGAGTVAAVILEPIPGANGVLIPPKGFWQRIREVTEKDGALLIADEILTGFGRTGRWLAIEHEGVIPDMITVAKGLTGGYGTLGAVLVHERVAHHFDENNSYCGLTGYAHPLSCAAALAAIKVYREDGLIERAASMETYLMEGLNRLKTLFPQQIVEVRGRGLLAALEFNCAAEKMMRLSKALKEKHLLAYVRPDEGTLILSPPLTISTSDLDLGFSVIQEAIREALK
jgi:taurine--2-oxoglutarate transaminase